MSLVETPKQNYQKERERATEINPGEYWATLGPLLEERGIEPLDHMRATVYRWSGEIEDMPSSVFDPKGALNSPLLTTHRILLAVLNEKQPFSETVAKEIFPYWWRQLKDAQDFIEGF